MKEPITLPQRRHNNKLPQQGCRSDVQARIYLFHYISSVYLPAPAPTPTPPPRPTSPKSPTLPDPRKEPMQRMQRHLSLQPVYGDDGDGGVISHLTMFAGSFTKSSIAVIRPRTNRNVLCLTIWKSHTITTPSHHNSRLQ